MNRIVKRLIYFLLGAMILAVAFSVAINLHMINYASEFIAADADKLSETIKGKKQTVVVLGAYVYENGQPCPMLEDRLLAGIDTFKKGYVNTILLSGDHGTRGYDEVNSMKLYTLNNNVQKESVFLDHAGFSTYDSIIRAREIFEVESAVISTQLYHLTRAVYIARKSGIDAYGIQADLRRYPRSEMTGYIVREWLARIKDFFYVNVFKPKPVFLGEKIPITGSSDASYDLPEDMR